MPRTQARDPRPYGPKLTVFDASGLAGRAWPLVALCLLAGGFRGAGAERVALPGHVPAPLAQARPLGRLPGTTNLQLAIGLPLRNREALTNLLRELYDPASPLHGQFLTPEQFTERFGPAEADYQKVVKYAQAHHLDVTARPAGRTLVEVAGSVADIEQTFSVTLRTYAHPAEARTCFAPDTEPRVEAGVPILHVSGLDNYLLPHPMNLRTRTATGSSAAVTPYSLNGSGPGGTYTGNDFRAAYAPGVTNTGSGQFIAIVDVGGPYYTNDIYMYQTNAGLSTNIVITNILLSGWTGIPTGTNDDDGEEVLDIDMAMSLAPGATILNYEGEAHAVFNQIAVDNQAKQITLSYGFGIDETIRQYFLQFAAQGQSFFQASGDGGGDLSGGGGLTGNPYATIVGGTALSTSGAGGPWLSETTWVGSGGGVSSYGIPPWQQGLNLQTAQGSAAFRNYPDVAMLADTAIFVYFRNGQPLQGVGGTSASSPQWAGFMALINQAAAAQSRPPVGFANPAIYALGKGPVFPYTNAFHDINTGNTLNGHNPLAYYATNGYDLCTGWGSPRGSNTIAALLAVGTNDFTLNASVAACNLVPGSSATTVLRLVPMNGFGGSASLSISGLPNGVTASFSASTLAAGSTCLLSFSAANTAVAGTNTATVTAVSGGLVHSLGVTLVVAPPVPGATVVNLAAYYNRAGIYSDGRSFSGGLDTVGFAYSADLLGRARAWNGVSFGFGPSNTLDVVAGAGQTMALPVGQSTTLLMLAAAINGNQNNQSFTVTYTDNSTSTFVQSISDWASPQNYAGESIIATMPYRNSGGGTRDLNTGVNIYGYSLTLNQTKTVKSITLPNNNKVVVLALALALEPASVSLASYFNRAGMYTDGTTFTNPATGGLDGGGAAYSATLLGAALNWNGVQFNFAAPNLTNVIAAASQTIALPTGNYSALRILATGLQGNQPSQAFTVTYTDTSTANFSQGLSDWFTPQNYGGESKAFASGHRNLSNGTADNRAFYLYGYSFALNSGKLVQSLRLPNNGNVAVLAITLIPNWPPAFTLSPFTMPGVIAGQAYSGTIATNALDLTHDPLTFAKTSGPAWLNIAANGALSGTPLSPDAGLNTFGLRVTDPGGASGTALLNLEVTAAPPIMASMSTQGANLLLNWSGGIAPYQVEVSTNLGGPDWRAFGGPTSGGVLVSPSNPAAFYRVVGQ